MMLMASGSWIEQVVRVFCENLEDASRDPPGSMRLPGMRWVAFIPQGEKVNLQTEETN
jgi:hypothetical protein